MAFQQGSQINPALARADYSGFGRGARSIGQGLASLGQDIGEGIKEYEKNKKITASAIGNFEGAAGANPDIIAAAKTAGGDISKALDRLQGGNASQKDALLLSGFGNTYLQEKANQQKAELGKAQLDLARLKLNQAQQPSVYERGKAAGLSDAEIFIMERTGNLPPSMKGPPKLSALQESISTMSEASGISPEKAAKIKTGIIKTFTDPVTKTTSLIDISTGEITPLQSKLMGEETPVESEQEETSAQREPQEQDTTLFEKAQKTTGIVPSLLMGLQRVAGMAGIEVGSAPELIEAKQQVVNSSQALVRALAMNDRFPVGEQERIREMVDTMPGFFKDPISLAAKMRGVEKGLRDSIDKMQKRSNNPNLPVADRRGALRAANDMLDYLDVLGVPTEEEEAKITKQADPEQSGGRKTRSREAEKASAMEAQQAGERITVTTQADYDALPSGTPYVDSQGNFAIKK